MTNVRFYLGLLKMTSDAADEAGLSGLTNADRDVLLLVWEQYADGATEKEIACDVILEQAAALGKKISKAQFYKSMKTFEHLNIVERVNSPRSQTYMFKA